MEKIKTKILYPNSFSRKSCCLEDDVEKPDRQVTDTNIIRRMRFMCSIIKATDKHSEYVTRIAAPLQQLLHERPSILRLYCT